MQPSVHRGVRRVIVEYNHMAGPTAIFMALLAVHGEEEARRRKALLSSGRAFSLAVGHTDARTA